MYTYSFEKLRVWNDARTVVKHLYSLTEQFPASEKYGLVSQIRRGCVSIASNIAEGSSCNTGRDRAHFYQIAYSSCIETINQLILSNDLGFVNVNQLNTSREIIEIVCRKLAALRNSQLVESGESL